MKIFWTPLRHICTTTCYRNGQTATRVQWYKTHHSNYLGHRLVEQLAAASYFADSAEAHPPRCVYIKA